MFNPYPVSVATGAFITFTGGVIRLFMVHVNCCPEAQQNCLNVSGTFYCLLPNRRKIVVAKQNYRCAGCGTRIDPGTVRDAGIKPFI